MRKLTLLILPLSIIFMLQSCMVSRQNDGYLGLDVKNVRTISVPMLIAKPIIKLSMTSDPEEREIARFISHINGVKLTTGKIVSMSSKDAARLLSNRNNMDNWLSVKNNGNVVYVNAKQRRDRIRQIAVTVAEEDDMFIYALIKCNLHPDDLSKMLNAAMRNKDEMKDMVKDISGD